MNHHGFIPVARIMGVLFLLPSVAVLALGGYFYHSTQSFIAKSVSCQGRVDQMIASSGQNGTMYSPTFTFTDASGNIHHGKSSVSSNPPAYAVGDPIAVRYDLQNPQDYRIDSFWMLWLGPIICAGISIPFFIVSMVMLFLVPFAIKKIWPPPPPLPQ